ncbi:unnamed protein product [Prunus armeniaca]|uniref:Leucine-rich repeat-containing N-terminal plant-type domain-containing protein n=1 Tax=Prunus armeniaca TaxID=36596 RepID=A0A6J5VDK2_PRUAR|nr:hypothetical protein GBA52_024917 [Prunus armeniaca]CAB4286292.1 unnamed protein product [Prunus armeniaca]
MGLNSAASILLVSLIILFVILSLETIKLGFCNDDHNVGCIDIERKALLKFKQGLEDSLDRLSSWVGKDCCKWSGVGCNNITGRVNKLDLCNRFWSDDDGAIVVNVISGEINPSLLYLDLNNDLFQTDLDSLGDPNETDLDGLGDPIETDLQWLATLSSLKYLNLGGVDLTKAASYWLPTINMLPSLVELHLPSCGLSILPLTLPSINFTSLLVLDLSHNYFTSTIPPWLFNLKSMRYLKLSYNSFQGSIPKSIGNLTSLEKFYLTRNQMSGIIPESLGELSSLVSLYIYGNTWEGAITEAHFLKHFLGFQPKF